MWETRCSSRGFEIDLTLSPNSLERGLPVRHAAKLAALQ